MPLLKNRYRGSFPSDYVPTLAKDTFANAGWLLDNDCKLLSKNVFCRLSQSTFFFSIALQADDARTSSISSQRLWSLRHKCSFSFLQDPTRRKYWGSWCQCTFINMLLHIIFHSFRCKYAGCTRRSLLFVLFYKILHFNTIYLHIFNSRQNRERKCLTTRPIWLVLHPNRISFRFKRSAKKRSIKTKTNQSLRDAQPTLISTSKPQLNGNVAN